MKEAAFGRRPEGGVGVKGLTQVTGYGELVRCEQEKAKGLSVYDRGPCKLAEETTFFTTKLTETEDCRVVMMRRPCIECKCNKGPVEVFWKFRDV